jgi:hypothetical protein
MTDASRRTLVRLAAAVGIVKWGRVFRERDITLE